MKERTSKQSAAPPVPEPHQGGPRKGGPFYEVTSSKIGKYTVHLAGGELRIRVREVLGPVSQMFAFAILAGEPRMVYEMDEGGGPSGEPFFRISNIRRCLPPADAALLDKFAAKMLRDLAAMGA